ncbi:hypothetical protein [Arthrobacter burdickii]|uniref:Uncharacterized protein n=1 Tax=Arthrobacter burdickii TaxID=3035920 RepID=A0ABT8K3B2_9MICC|nr:hypothetical protein [Arthrobacter burdickii]MDN4611915.1 hypothetical protein [Arthrobacter burdickii]
MTKTFPADGIQNLILNHKGDRSYGRLERDAGGYPSSRALQKAATSPASGFPDPRTISGLSRALNVPIADVIRAYAVSLGLPMEGEDKGVLRIVGAGTLPKQSQDLLISLARELRTAYETPWGEQPEVPAPAKPELAAAELTKDDVELAARVGDHGIDPEENQP